MPIDNVLTISIICCVFSFFGVRFDTILVYNGQSTAKKGLKSTWISGLFMRSSSLLNKTLQKHRIGALQ